MFIHHKWIKSQAIIGPDENKMMNNQNANLLIEKEKKRCRLEVSISLTFRKVAVEKPAQEST